jgi:hypothetical protein
MAQMTLFNCFAQDLVLGKHQVGTSVFKVMLTNVAPVLTNTVAANITEIAAGNGYSAGGVVTTVTETRTGDVCTVFASDETVTASGVIGPFRYAVVYNDTFSGLPLVGFIDTTVETTMASLDTFTTDFDQVNGIFDVTV